MKMIIINGLLGAAAGITLGSIGCHVNDFHYWIIIGCLLLTQINSRIN